MYSNILPCFIGSEYSPSLSGDNGGNLRMKLMSDPMSEKEQVVMSCDMTKPNKLSVRPATSQISLGIRPA